LQVAGWLQNVRGVRLALIISLGPLAWLGAGCFYTDPINQRPSIMIEQLSSTAVFHQSVVNLNAVADDPDGDEVTLSWHAFACTDATPAPDGSRQGCDPDPLDSGTMQLFSFTTPTDRADGTTPVGAMYVTLDATDTYGAAARPGQELILPVGDAPPTIALSKDPRHSYVVNIPLHIYALIGDSDDGPDVLRVAWTAFSPTGSEPLTTESTAQPDPDHLQLTTTLQPDVLGEWTVQASVTDPSNVSTMQPLVVDVGPDEPPCLGTWTPAAPPSGDSLPISGPTLFEVLVVVDDLDPYPSVPTDPILGTTTFSWSLLPPGATTREPLTSATGASVALDPASYHPGDIAELRVEIYDRNHTPIPCADTDPTCSIGANACMQRLTWRVEMQ
jgi:hypothetical protein